MSITQSASGVGQWIATGATHDFCPWANKYVYWLKEPIGWFVLATATSVLIGVFFNPVGWTLAAGLLAVTILGLGFPLIAMAAVRCELKPVNSDLSEGESSHLILTVVNRLPIPIMGLMIENYLTVPAAVEEDEATASSRGDCGLARVPALSRASYRLPVQPEYRGRYPICKPRIACSFPFGIYTARRELKHIVPVEVRPLVLPLVSELEWGGRKMADVGSGQRATSHGDFLAVREFRRGDSLRSIHWAQSAKQDTVIVCERGGPQRSPLAIHLSTERSRGDWRQARDHLAWRVRIVASICDLLAARHIPFALWIDGQRHVVADGAQGLRRVMETLTNLPLDPIQSQASPAEFIGHGIFVHARLADEEFCPAHCVALEIRNTTRDLRASSTDVSAELIDLNRDITEQLTDSLQGVYRANCAA